MILAALRGLAKPSLRGVVRRLHRRHMSRNSAALELRHTLGRRLLATINGRPRLLLTLVLLGYAAVASLAAVAPIPDWVPAAPDEDDYYRDLQAINLGLLGAQTALLGLVYPLVIALVGLLFEARSSRGSRLQVYFRETEALAVGGTALAFVIMVSLQLLSYAVLPTNVVVAITALNILWFTVNLGALGFFVVRSLDFVRPARRHSLIRDFLANSAWSAQLHDGMMLNQWGNAVHYGHLPGPADEEQAIIMPFDFDPPVLKRRLNRPRMLSDVRLGVLAALLRHRPRERPLSFSPWPGSTYENEIVLARSSNPDLSALERFLITAAFPLRSVSRHDAPPSTDQILSEAGADLLSLMEARRYEEFAALMSDTVDLHGLLYALAEEPGSTDQQAFNYGALKLEDSRSFASNWARAYRDLLIRAGDHPTADDRYFESCSYLAARVMRRALPVAPFDAAEPLFSLPAILFRALVDGAARRHAESAPGPVPRGSLFTPSGPGAAFYRSAWLRFVGGWERLGDSVTPKGGAVWDELQRMAPRMARHLQDTALMTAQAAKAGERQAIGWTVDMLLKWRERIQLQWGGYHGYALVRPVVTFELLGRAWEDVALLPLMLFGEAPTEAAVFDAAVENAWLDTQVVLACSLIGLFGEADGGGRINDGPAEAAGALFRSQSFDPGASSHPRERSLTAMAILHSILRLVGAGDRFEEGYGHSIGALAEQIDRLEGPNYVSARVYSWGGEADVYGQAGLQILLLAASLSTSGRRKGTGFSVDEDLKALLLPANDRARRRLSEHLAALRRSIAEMDTARGCAIVSSLGSEDCDATELAERLAALEAILVACEAEIGQAREADIRSAPIDRARLAAVGDAAAATAFSRANGAFPLPFFSRVELVEEDLQPVPYRLRTGKGQYTAPLLQDPVINEADWWAGTLHDAVGAVVLNDVGNARPAVQRAPGSAAEYWTDLKNAIAAVAAEGQTPIIVRNSRGEPDCLTAWHYDSSGAKRPPDVRIRRVEGRGPGYDFDLNDVPLYSSSGAGAATWVLGKEVLDTVEFQRFADGRPVEVRFEPDPADIWGGIVSVVFARRITLAKGRIWRISNPPTEPSN